MHHSRVVEAHARLKTWRLTMDKMQDEVAEDAMDSGRRRFVSGAAGVLASLCAPLGLAQSGTRLRVGTIPIVDSAPLFVGIEKGYFKEFGLEIDTTPAPGGAALLPALAAGQFQVAFSNTTSTLLAIGEGLPFRFVTAGCSTGAQGPDLAGLMVRTDSPIRSGTDLEGKRVAVNNRNNIMWIRTASWIDKNQGHSDRTTFVEIPFPQMVDALAGGQVDAAMVNEPFLSVGLQAHKDKVKVLSWPMSDTAPSGVVSQYVANNDWLTKNPELAERFARGLGRGVGWVRQNQGNPEWEKLVSGYTRIPPEHLRGIALPVYDSVIDPSKIREMIDLMRRYKVLNQDLDVSALIYPTALHDYSK
jgi:NitT/TauT family transport system substrate-binding protein